MASLRRFEESHEADHQGFADMLRGARGLPVYLMADTLDEDYRIETLPHALGQDRREMLERKLKQLYRTTPYYGAVMQERETSRRRDDRYLFAALTNPDGFSTWLQILTANAASVAGVFLLPTLSLGLLKKLELKEPNLLLVSKHEAGVRQTFLKDQRFRISRLTPLRHAQSASIEFSAEEIRNTRMYLDALNVMHVDDVLTVIILDHDGALAPLTDAVVAGRRNIRALRVGPEEIVSKVGIDRETLASSPDALHLFLLGHESSPKFNLAPPAMTSAFVRHRLTRRIYAATSASALVAALWTGLNVYQLIGLKGRAAELETLAQQETLRYQKLSRSFPPAPVPSEQLKLTVEVAERIAGMGRLPDTAFQVVSHTLDRYPNVRLNALQWKVGRTATSAEGGAATLPLSQSALLDVELTGTPGDYKETLASLNSFARDLGTNDKVAGAKIVKVPLNVASSGTLSGSTTAPRREGTEPARFVVEVTLKPGV
ncbi:MAG TPA: hypothetical protein VMH32_21275 [Burkholderiales bacterium]|nr:hypothetical protein [Burkholderiales bacterium]